VDVLIGREEEQNLIETRLQQAREGRGGALVLRGEAGIGKTALLEQVAAGAEDICILRALGVEAEAELPFSALHELLRPVLQLLDELPEPQAAALKAAFALAPTERVDRFSIYAATLSLLAAAAEEQTVLCLVDDAQWLDQASAEALAFASRRLDNEALLMLFSAREPAETTFASPGIPELRVGGLTAAEARALLATAAPDLPAMTGEHIIGISLGNPLALLEFSVAGGEAVEADLVGPHPVSESVERRLLERSSRLSADARRALLFAAAGDPTESEAIWAALEGEQISADAVSEAQSEGLLVRGRRLDFCHPLARSAIWHAAPPAERRTVHAALAATAMRPERRAWHLAAAAVGPDEIVAMALEEAASTAGVRGGVSAEAKALERAARLTPAAEPRARRLLLAGFAAEAAGRLEHAEELLAEAADLTESPAVRGDAVARRSYLLFDRGDLDHAIELATGEAERAPPVVAARVLTASGVVHALVHRLDIPTALTTAERAAELAGPGFHDDLDVCHMLAWTRRISGRTGDALALALECVERVDPGTILAVDFALHFVFLEDYGRGRELLDRTVARTREMGALGNLAYALDMLVQLDTRTGRITSAYAGSLESVQLAEQLGDTTIACALGNLARVEAALGRTEDAQAHATRSLEISEGRGDEYNAVRAHGSLGFDALTRGDLAASADWLEQAVETLDEGGVHHPNLFRVHADLIEAQARSGRREDAERNLTRLREDAKLTQSVWGTATAARCQALLAEESDADGAFAEALQLHADDPDELERARTVLCYGEWLRRRRRRRDSREHLHGALETFERIGARPWAERARAELRASGERLHRRGPAAHEQLTPQELQVSLAAADGLTNKEIGARLFLSPKTVEFHLSRAYRKLDVNSRVELARLLASQPGVVEPLSA
jgi:DNA-binding CsgD family transcriptional regulator